MAKKMGEFLFGKKQPVIAERKTFFPKAIAKFKLPSLSQRSKSLIKPLLKNSFSTIFQGLDPERLHFTLVGLFAGLTIAASCARAAPGSPKEKQAFSKSNCQIQTPGLSQRSKSLTKPLLKNSFPTIFKALDPERLHFTLVGLFAGFTIVASCASCGYYK